MSNSYFRANTSNFILFAGLVAGTGIIVVLIYGALYGFNNMVREVEGSSRLLVAAYNAPPGSTNAAGAFVPVQPGYSYGQGVVYGTAAQTGQPGYSYGQGVVYGTAAQTGQPGYSYGQGIVYGTAAQTGQPGYSYGQGIVYGTAPQTRQYGYGYPQAAPAGPTAGQYVCPLHGGVGLPNVDPNGFPTCPICGQRMQFNYMSANTALQMVGGTTAPQCFTPMQGQIGAGNTTAPQCFTPMQGQIGAGNTWNPTAAAFNRGAG